MTDRFTDARIEEHLRNAIADSTPDIFDDLMEEISSGQETPDYIAAGPVPSISRRRRTRRWYKAIAGCAAALMIVVGAFTMFQKGQDKVFAVIDIDVNPSVELSVNNDHKVVEAKAINEDGEVILGDMELEGVDLNTACNALAGSMFRHGYLTELSNSVMVSVRAEDELQGREIEQMVSSDMSNCLQGSDISGAVLGQYVAGSQELDAFAEENRISFGKAWLIKSLLATNSKHMTEESLLKLSTQELILLGQERGVDVDDFYGQVNASSYITREDAADIAIGAAGVSGVQADACDVEFDCDDGAITYEVEFSAGGKEYEYEINAKTGEIIGQETEADDDGDDDDDDDADDDDDDDADDDDDDHDRGVDDDDDDDDDDDHDDDDDDDDDDDHDDDDDDDDDD